MIKPPRNRKRKPKPRKLVPISAPNQATATTATAPADGLEIYRFHPLDMAEADAGARARRELVAWIGAVRCRITGIFDEIERVLAAVREPSGLLSGALDEVVLLKVMGGIEQAETYASGLRAAVKASKDDGGPWPDPVALALYLEKQLELRKARAA